MCNFVEGGSLVSLRSIISVFSSSARERNSLSLWLIPFEFQNGIFRLVILEGEDLYE